jgi:hypothetical protein
METEERASRLLLSCCLRHPEAELFFKRSEGSGVERNCSIASSMQKGLTSPMRTIALLTISNIFMTFAWYGHLKYRRCRFTKLWW